MHVPGAEVEPLVAVVLVLGECGLPGPEVAVRELPDIDVEVAGRLRGHVGEAAAVRREDGVGVEELVAQQRAGFPGGHLGDREADVLAVPVHGEDDEASVRGPGRQRVVAGTRGELVGDPGLGIHAPDGARHRDSDALPVRGPRRRPGRAARRGREVVVVHVVPAVARGGIRLGDSLDDGRRRPALRLGEELAGRQQKEGEAETQVHERSSRGGDSTDERRWQFFLQRRLKDRRHPFLFRHLASAYRPWGRKSWRRRWKGVGYQTDLPVLLDKTAEIGGLTDSETARKRKESTACGKAHTAFDGRCIPSEPRLCEALIVAFQSEYTRYSSLTRLVSRAPRPSRRSRGFHHRLLMGLLVIREGDWPCDVRGLERLACPLKPAELLQKCSRAGLANSPVGAAGLERRLQPAPRPAGPRAVRCEPEWTDAQLRDPGERGRPAARLRRAVPAEAGVPSGPGHPGASNIPARSFRPGRVCGRTDHGGFSRWGLQAVGAVRAIGVVTCAVRAPRVPAEAGVPSRRALTGCGRGRGPGARPGGVAPRPSGS